MYVLTKSFTNMFKIHTISVVQSVSESGIFNVSIYLWENLLTVVIETMLYALFMNITWTTSPCPCIKLPMQNWRAPSVPDCCIRGGQSKVFTNHSSLHLLDVMTMTALNKLKHNKLFSSLLLFAILIPVHLFLYCKLIYILDTTESISDFRFFSVLLLILFFCKYVQLRTPPNDKTWLKSGCKTINLPKVLWKANYFVKFLKNLLWANPEQIKMYIFPFLLKK